MRKILIISPHFPPINAADIHRVRQSLPFFETYGYEPTVLTVLSDHVDMPRDLLLEKDIPKNIVVHKVSALETSFKGKVKLGNLGIRAFYQLYKKGNELLKSGNFDLIYFSTTVFACVPLGRLWKEKFGVPYIIDMQDPWRNDYYLTVPPAQRPPKFWFAHRLNSILEKYTIPKVDGLISVSKGYVDTLKLRYPQIENVPSKILTFGASIKDFDLLKEIDLKPSIELKEECINIVYTGRGGQDLRESVSIILRAFKMALDQNTDYQKCHFWFIGTSYAPDGKGKKTIESIANDLNIDSYVTEITNRQPYFEALSLLKQSDIIFIPGSSDTNYTPSKLYPYLLAKKPMLCVFHSESGAVDIMNRLNVDELVLFDHPNAIENCCQRLSRMLDSIPLVPDLNWENFSPYTAEQMTKAQCEFFDNVLSHPK
ncbi:hypothetical protein M0G43_06560 [Subsaxibacter sp. CAU 1640]|uniref:hypothetical protein n=1 Tax=Subsaxibacter sp. CAU 1640 TaxID=2933271 RepID=UPI002005FA58|nr:hypothetical protein [Subsaxibacter sp. CAU 1640]MCK7590227.1 hypothetical protein [Subsaxibacter sp. CAU 1640]